MPLFSSCWYWNGGTLNTLVIPAESLNNAIVASGGDMPTVRGSSLAKFASPHCLAAAICSIIACTDTFTDRHRDLILLGEIGDGVDLRIARVEQDRLRRESGD